jgi:hypothetical protein
MAITVTRDGYGQVEPNQLSAQKTGQIYASLPLDDTVKVLQNGEFMFYDYKTGKVRATDSTGLAEPMLVFNEIKLYEPFWRTSYKDFAMIRKGDNYITSDLAIAGIGGGADWGGVDAAVTWTDADGTHTLNGHSEYPYRMHGAAPRLFKTNIGDIFTTNMVVAGASYQVGDILTPKPVTNTVDGSTFSTLVLTKDNTATKMAFVVVKEYTMPDGQPGLKLQRVA